MNLHSPHALALTAAVNVSHFLVVEDMQTTKQHSYIVLAHLPEVLHLIATHIAGILYALCAQALHSSYTSLWAVAMAWS